jgi:hypothetical protein
MIGGNQQMKKKKFTQITALLLLLFALLVHTKLSLDVKAATTKVAIQLWDLVDSGKHLDWDGGTEYYIRFNNAIARWNALKPGMIRKDSAFVLEDVYVSDYYSDLELGGITKADGVMQFNTRVMDKLSASKRGQVCTHEIGHALGLAHNQSTDVMYKSVTGKYKLSENDKASFKKSYSTY